MRLSYILILLFFYVTANSQIKEYEKLNELFDKGDFEKCILQAEKYSKKEPGELIPLIYLSKANFELYKKVEGKKKKGYLKNSLKTAQKIKKKDKKEVAINKYSSLLEEIHKETLKYANELYYDEKQKSSSKTYFDYLAKIYNDTLSQFYDFHPELRKKDDKTKGVNAWLADVNKKDKSGRKQGKWKKIYPNGVVAYEVYFKDDKPIGTHKRYHENGKLMAKLVFDEIGEWADAEMYDENESLIAKGKYQNQKKQGLWVLLKNDFKVGEVNYLDDKKHGVSKSYYPNGNVSEEKNWENGVENGVWRQYFSSGKTKLESRIEKGVRNSVYFTYHQNGQFEIKGRYKEDHMDGEWIYYDRKGKEIQRIKYEMGKTKQQSVLDEKENEAMKKLEENRHRLIDPAHYINNPNEYFKKKGIK